MRNALMIGLLAFPLLSSCTTDPYTGRADLGSHMTAGILLGAAAGALGGRAIGVSPVEGAAAGMIAGGAMGAATTPHAPKQRRYYRDTRGYCYYIDAKGQPRYDYTVTC